MPRNTFKPFRDPYGKVSVYSALANAQYYLGDYQAARQNCEAGIELAEKIQAWRLLGHITAMPPRSIWQQAIYNSAISNAQLTIQMGVERNHSEMVAIGNYIIGNVFSWLLDFEQAFKYYQSGYAANKNPFLSNNLLFRLGFSQSFSKNTEIGLGTLEQVIHSTTEQGLALEAIQSRLAKLLVLYENGNFIGLSNFADEIAKEAKQRELISIHLTASTVFLLLDLQAHGSREGYQNLASLMQDAKTLSNTLLELVFVLKLCQVEGSNINVFPIDQARVTQLLTILRSMLKTL